ncbi:CHAT domain protein [Pirellulimonas nuda]|uniref:CHAT domain protein n=1 Tax=Pirellulimonas nuda TaxID=2528009 RepID=A0A518DJ67_9BACT|nr:hypothetical protein [Pirellulimonas nuda]QDU91513.1 CHAT domain protein [Pirellulimonas nuda]
MHSAARLLSFAACLLAAQAAPGQGASSSIPDRSYYSAIELIYRGDYRRAQRAFADELRGSVKTVDSRWVDSICYHALQGEALYQQGLYGPALDEMNRACSLLMVYPKWLLSAQFRQQPRPDNNPGRRAAPWGPSQRQPVYASLPDTVLIAQGDLNSAQRAAQQGGVVQSAQFWRVDAVEVLRAAALAIRRRNEMLGPLGPHDRLSKELADVLGRGGLAPPNHWSGAWTELLTGLAQEGVGDAQLALPHLTRATLLDGRYDHRLTGAALLEQGRIAMNSGAGRAAAGLLLEALTAAYAFEDVDVMCEAVSLGRLNHIAMGAEGPYPPLAPVIALAESERLEHLEVVARLALAEDLLAAGAPQRAAPALGRIASSRSDWVQGRLGPRLPAVRSMLELTAGKPREANDSLARAVAGQAAVSLRTFQIGQAVARYRAGEISPRLAADVFADLLRDPTAADWSSDPLDAVALLKSAEADAFDSWFDAALQRDDELLAITVSDLTKRRRFFAAQPYGGRLLALRRLLGPSDRLLTAAQQTQRQALLTKLPELVEMNKNAAAIHRDLRNDPGVFAAGGPTSDADRMLRDFARLADGREAALRRAVLARQATDLAFPPARSANEAQDLLTPGQALMVIHETRTGLFGFLLASEGYHTWRLPPRRDLENRIGAALQAMGNFGASREMKQEEAESSEWRRQCDALAKLLVQDARLDLNKTTELVIVPDGPLWHAPWEALPVGDVGGEQTLIDLTPVRYAPTIGLALGDTTPLRPVRKTAVVLPPDGGARADAEQIARQWDRLGGAVREPVRLSAPAPAPTPLLASLIDQAVIRVPSEIDPSQPYAWPPMAIDRTPAIGRLEAWMALPANGPQRLVISGLHTAAGDGLKSSGSRRGDPPPTGRELFHASCGMLASGARTMLVSRWNTGGPTQLDLEREFLLTLPDSPADQAWRRAVTLARGATLDPYAEPRLKPDAKRLDAPTASHPFFWGGFLLIDTGLDPRPQPEQAPEQDPEAEAAAKP